MKTARPQLHPPEAEPRPQRGMNRARRSWNLRRALVAEPLPDTVTAAIQAEEWRARKRRRGKQAKARGRRLLTVCGRFQGAREVPDLRMAGRWLEDAGFPQSQTYEVQVEAGRLTLRAV